MSSDAEKVTAKAVEWEYIGQLLIRSFIYFNHNYQTTTQSKSSTSPHVPNNTIMGLFSSSDPIKQQEKMLAKEEKNEDKSLKQAVKDLAHAEKEEHKALKVNPPDSIFSVSVPMIHRVPEKCRG
jgi:hypothetical protein